MPMPTIEVDFDVFKALTNRRPTEDVTENDVLRELLRLPRRTAPAPTLETPAPNDWVTKGVRLPAGTEMRATYKGQTHLGRVSDGALVLNGTSYNSPSAAAMSITQSPVNGWTFWEVRRPGAGKWTRLTDLRKRS
jgi:hypothetical protein